MYKPDEYASQDPHLLADLCAKNPIATLISTGADGLPYASYPLILLRQHGDDLLILTHLAKANTHTQHLNDGQEVLMSVQGPWAYISSAATYEKLAAPTVNYLVAQLRGTIETVSDSQILHNILWQTIEHFEPAGAKAYAPLFNSEYVGHWANYIWGYQIKIKSWRITAKLSQDKSPNDRIKIAQWLESAGDGLALKIAEHMKKMY